jgi:hypothetical protein
MRVNIGHLVIGRIKIGRKVFDLSSFQIRDELSSDSIYKYAIECADKIKIDPRFGGDELKIETFYRDLVENVKFFSVEPSLLDVPKIYIDMKVVPNLPKAVMIIPNDYGPSEAKSSTFHETIHFLGKYTDDILLSDEGLVDNMVDSYLHDDKDALFEHRWLKYSITSKVRVARTVTCIIAGFITGIELGKGYFGIAIAIMVWISCITVYKLFKRIKRKSMVYGNFGVNV